MDNDYSIDSLIEQFEEHAIIYEKQLQKDKELGREYAFEKINQFNIGRALHNICKEIQSLKDKQWQD